MGGRISTVFMGTPAFAVPALETVAELTDLRLVVTQPDRPAGRGRRLEPPPVKMAALAMGKDVIQPHVVKGRRFAETIGAVGPDLIVTAAYGRILGRRLLDLPMLRCVNVHASLLPAYRGAAPINWAIVNGERETGVSIMRMEEGLDSGPVYRASKVEILPDETAGELTERLSRVGAEALAEFLGEVETARAVEQDHSLATHAPIIRKSDGIIDWSRGSRELHDHVRGFHPWPCATTLLEGRPLKIHRTAVIGEGHGAVPGTVLSHTPEGVDVACGSGRLRLTALQLPGKKRLDAAAFFSGKRLSEGTLLG